MCVKTRSKRVLSLGRGRIQLSCVMAVMIPMQKSQSVHQCLKWLYVVLFFTGCLCFRHRRDTLELTTGCMLYTHIIRIALVVSFAGGIALKLSDAERGGALIGPLTPVLKFTLAFECLNCTVSYIQVAATMDAGKRAHMQLAEDFRKLDEKFVVDFPDIRWNYDRMVRKYTPLTIFVGGFYIIVAQIYLFNVANCSCDLFNTFLIAISYALLTLALGVVGFLHIGCMDLLRIRFRLIRRLVVVGQQQCRQLDNEQRLLELARLIAHFQSYTQLMLQMNAVFGNVCAASVFYDWGFLTNMTFLLCRKAAAAHTTTTAKEFVFIVLIMIPHIYKVLMTAVYGYLANKERNNCVQSITMCGNNASRSAPLSDAIESFLHWKLQHRYTLTIGSVTRCNLNVAFIVLNGIANYVIILMQLQFQEISIASHLLKQGAKGHTDAEASIDTAAKWR